MWEIVKQLLLGILGNLLTAWLGKIGLRRGRLGYVLAVGLLTSLAAVVFVVNDWVVLAVMAGLASGGVFGFLLALCYWKFDRPQRLVVHLEAFREKLSGAPVGARLVLAQTANSSLQNLTTRRSQRERGDGEDLRLAEYVEILRESHEFGAPSDVTLFMKATPAEWYAVGSESAKELRKHVETYFTVQTNVKRIRRSDIRIRRFLLLPLASIEADGTSQKRFIEDHKAANIDLFCIDPSSLTRDQQEVAKDMAIFLSKDGSGWVIQSDFDEKKIEKGMVNAYLDYSGPKAAEFVHLKTCLLAHVLNVYSGVAAPLEKWKPCILGARRNPPDSALLKAHYIGVPHDLVPVSGEEG